jgi:hypothetical protein
MTFLERSLHRVSLHNNYSKAIYIYIAFWYEYFFFVNCQIHNFIFCSSSFVLKYANDNFFWHFSIKCSSWIWYQYIFGNVHIFWIYWLICMNTNYQLNFIFWNMEWIIFQKLKLHSSIFFICRISRIFWNINWNNTWTFWWHFISF